MKKIIVLLFLLSLFNFAFAQDEDVGDRAKTLLEKFSKYNEEIIKEGDKVKKIISQDNSYDEFIYDKDGKIIRIDSYYSTGALKEKAIFFREPSTGEVLIIKKDGLGDDVYFINLDERQKSYVKANENKVNQYTTYLSSILYSVDGDFDYKYSDEGDLIINYSSREFVYDKDGRLKRDLDKYFFYNENDILQRVETRNNDGQITCVENYKDGRISDAQFYDNGKIIKQVLYNDEGNIEEYYENEVKYAQATFDKSGKKVLKIEYTETL